MIIWKDVSSMPGIQANRAGGIRSANLAVSYTSKLGKPVSYIKKSKEISSKNGNGYRQFTYRGNFCYVHRVVWEAFNGPIPAGLTINHLNGIPSDNRIENLELATLAENIRHAAVHLPKKYHSGMLKPSPEDVRLIRYWAVKSTFGKKGGNIKEIAKIFRISYYSVLNIANGESYSYY